MVDEVEPQKIPESEEDQQWIDAYVLNYTGGIELDNEMLGKIGAVLSVIQQNKDDKLDVISTDVALNVPIPPDKKLVFYLGDVDGWQHWYNDKRVVDEEYKERLFKCIGKPHPPFDEAMRAFNEYKTGQEEEPQEKPTPAILPQGAKLPVNAPQRTFEESRAMGRALADSSSGRYWNPSLDGLSLIHRRPGEPLSVGFDPRFLPEIWSGTKPDTPDAMKAFLQERGFNGWKVSQMAMSSAILKEHTPIAIDEFVDKLFDPRSTKEKNAKRVWVWETICAILNMRLNGVRAGVYKDKSKNDLDLAFRNEPLIMPSPGSRKFANGQQTLWPDDIPVTIGFTMGVWGKEARKNPKALQYFGELEAILSIPCGKPSGAWAQCILATLNQKWREKAKNSDVKTRTRIDSNGDDHKTTSVKLPNKFTRRDLLVNEFPPEEQFSVMAILNSDRPKRAVMYWNEAMNILLEGKHISYWKELVPLPVKRKGWADDWLDQPLDIQPNTESRKNALLIQKAQKTALAAIKRKKRKDTATNKT